MKKSELLGRVGDAYARLLAALDGLSEEAASRTGLTSEWSVKDCLAHVAMWEREGARVVESIVAGTYRPRYDDETIERRNREAVEAMRGRAYAEVLGELRAAHAELAALLEGLPEELGEETYGFKFIAGVTFDHMSHHAAQIERFRES
ncbi:MAG TPA: maleylpyruvate isomerase N-terminal domain-containing protein [Pyrinomonadaceae bacterium]|nr:maleylpyruvate isomerase N-terminal domain-containing protein [Pyrinomonadaceae bacterium]